MRRALLGLILGFCAGCGSQAMRAAEHGDLATLRAEIASREKLGNLTNSEAADLGKAVAIRELAQARPERALERLRETRACAEDLDDALADRMKTHDAAGAEAALTRIEDGNLGDGDARAYLSDPDDAWRAVGVRALSREDDRERRVKSMLDPSPRVRRSAVRAASAASEPADMDPLFEVARLDPEPIVRTEAVRAMTQLARGDGEPRPKVAAALGVRLRDLWVNADDAVREDIGVAWTLSPIYENSGREALRTLLGGSGPGVIAAAGAVVRNRDGTSPASRGLHQADAKTQKDTELVQTAGAVLVRAITVGSRRDRLHALAIAPLRGELLDAVRKAAADDDTQVRLSALARLAGSNPDRAGAIRALELLAGRKEDPESSRARLALATAGDVRIQAWIEDDLGAKDASQRLAALAALAALGRSARGAILLADPDASVRTRAACTLIAAARTRR